MKNSSMQSTHEQSDDLPISKPSKDDDDDDDNDDDDDTMPNDKTTHTIYLPDGTKITKVVKTKHLPDGTIITKTKTETKRPSVKKGGDSTSKSGFSRIIKTVTKKLSPDGSSVTETTTERIDFPTGDTTSSSTEDLATDDTATSPASSASPQSRQTSQSSSSEETQVAKSRTNRRVLPDGRIETITTTVCTANFSPEENNADDHDDVAKLGGDANVLNNGSNSSSSSSFDDDDLNILDQIERGESSSSSPDKNENIRSAAKKEATQQQQTQSNKNTAADSNKRYSSISSYSWTFDNDDNYYDEEKAELESLSVNLETIDDTVTNGPPLPPEYAPSLPSSFSDRESESTLSHPQVGAQYISNEAAKTLTSADKWKKTLQKFEAEAALGKIDEESEHLIRSTRSSAESNAGSKALTINYPYDDANNDEDDGNKSREHHSFASSRASNEFANSDTGYPSDKTKQSDDLGLAIAKQVNEEDNAYYNTPIHLAMKYDSKPRLPFYKNRGIVILSTIALILVGICITLIVVFVAKNSMEVTVVETFVNQTTYPPTPAPTSHRDISGVREEIEANVLMRNVSFRNLTDDDPKSRALDWILHQDEAQLEVFDENLGQRYILALLAFSLDSSVWRFCGGGDHLPIMTTGVDNEHSHTKGDNHSDATTSCHGVSIEGDVHSSWLSNTDECEWMGVICVDGVVHHLELRENDLVGEIPPEIAGLQSLSIINFRENCIYGTIPPEIGVLSNLEILVLMGNGLSGLFPDELFDLTLLQQLDLGYQRGNAFNCTRSDGTIAELFYVRGDPEENENYGIEGEIFSSNIGKLENLRHLRLGDNYFSGTIDPAIGNLSQLAILSAGYNVFSGSLPNEITELGGLQELDLHQTNLTGQIPSNIGNMKSLEILNLWEVGAMHGSIPESMFNLTMLKVLHLDDNQFSGTISERVGNLVHLDELTLGRNSFTGTIPSELGLCEELSVLYIEDTQIIGALPEEVCQLANKELFSDDEYYEYLRADCLPNAETMVASFECECCSTCCDRTTGQCINDF